MNSGYSIHDLLADRTETLDKIDIEKFFVTEKDVYLSRLLGEKPYLLVGGRGMGKSMLMKYAELISDKEITQKKVLSVYVTFESSLVMERMQEIRDKGYYDPFRQWTFAKILIAVIEKVESLHMVSNQDKLAEEFFGSISLNTMSKALYRYVRLLENKNIIDAKELRDEAERILKTEISLENPSELLDSLENANATKQYLEHIIEDNELERIVLLFDEAAHALVPKQQEDFFSIFKSLNSAKISCKAAVYPAVTSYGRDFDTGHDAGTIRIDRHEKDDDYLSFFRKLLEKRIPQDSNLWKKLTSTKEAIPLLCYCCFGNPRFLFHLIDIFESYQTGSITAIIQKVCKKFVQDELWLFHDNAGSRQKKISKYSKLGRKFIVTTIIPNLVDHNNTWREKPKKELSIYFTIQSDIHDELKSVLDMLSYSGIISHRTVLKTGQQTSGHLYALNISVAVDGAVLKSDKATDNSLLNEINLLQRERYRQYTKSNSQVVNLINELNEHSGVTCSKCGEKLKEGWVACPICGTQIPKEKSLYFELREHPIDKLFVSDRIMQRIKDHQEQQFKTVGDILDASVEDLDAIYYIGPVRVKMIKGAAEEYVAG